MKHIPKYFDEYAPYMFASSFIIIIIIIIIEVSWKQKKKSLYRFLLRTHTLESDSKSLISSSSTSYNVIRSTFL